MRFVRVIFIKHRKTVSYTGQFPRKLPHVNKIHVCECTHVHNNTRVVCSCVCPSPKRFAYLHGPKRTYCRPVI